MHEIRYGSPEQMRASESFDSDLHLDSRLSVSRASSTDSPERIHSSPAHSHSSPGNMHSSPGHINSSPGHINSSPGHIHSSPRHIHSSPGHMHSSPGHLHSSPGNLHSSPGHIHSSPDRLQSSPESGRGLSSPHYNPFHASLERLEMSPPSRLGLSGLERTDSRVEHMDVSGSPTSWNPKAKLSHPPETTGEQEELESSEMKPPTKVPTRKRIRSGDSHTGLTQDLTEMLRLRKRSCPNLLKLGGNLSLEPDNRRRSQGNLSSTLGTPLQMYPYHHQESVDQQGCRDEYLTPDNSNAEPGPARTEISPTQPSDGGTESPGSVPTRDAALSSSSEGSGHEGSEQVN